MRYVINNVTNTNRTHLQYQLYVVRSITTMHLLCDYFKGLIRLIVLLLPLLLPTVSGICCHEVLDAYANKSIKWAPVPLVYLTCYSNGWQLLTCSLELFNVDYSCMCEVLNIECLSIYHSLGHMIKNNIVSLSFSLYETSLLLSCGRFRMRTLWTCSSLAGHTFRHIVINSSSGSLSGGSFTNSHYLALCLWGKYSFNSIAFHLNYNPVSVIIYANVNSVFIFLCRSSLRRRNSLCIVAFRYARNLWLLPILVDCFQVCQYHTNVCRFPQGGRYLYTCMTIMHIGAVG